MKLTQESFLGLKRHFLGVLSEPPSLWLVPSSGPKLLLSGGGGLRGEGQGCVVDFGTAESPGEERRILRVANLGQEPVALELLNPLPWLEARWRHGTGNRVSTNGTGDELELVVRHDFLEDQILAGSLQLIAESLDGERSVSEIQVRLATHRSQALGQYEFQGSPEPPKSFDFGSLDVAASGPEVLDSYTLSFRNRTSVPLRVSFSHLPAWLVFEVDGFQRRGPAAGRFFEREAPFQVDIRPVRNVHFLGSQRDRLLMETNDARPAFHRVELEIAARIESSKPHVTVEPLEEAAPPVEPKSQKLRPEIKAAMVFLLLLLLVFLLFSLGGFSN